MTISVFTPEGEFKESKKLWIDIAEEEPEGSYMVDTAHHILAYRYGWIRQKQWENKPFYTFPAEFKTILLLLGVH